MSNQNISALMKAISRIDAKLVSKLLKLEYNLKKWVLEANEILEKTIECPPDKTSPLFEAKKINLTFLRKFGVLKNFHFSVPQKFFNSHSPEIAPQKTKFPNRVWVENISKFSKNSLWLFFPPAPSPLEENLKFNFL